MMFHTGVIVIPTESAESYQRAIDDRDTRQVGEVLATWSHTFADRYIVDVRVLGSVDGMCTEAVFFCDGSEVTHSEISEALCSTYVLETPQGDVYRVHVMTAEDASSTRHRESLTISVP